LNMMGCDSLVERLWIRKAKIS